MRIAILSCAAYSDTWNPFFRLFKRFWPDCKYPAYLITDRFDETGYLFDPEQTDYLTGWSSQGGTWCEILIDFIDSSDDIDPILVFLDDFWLNAPVNTALIQRGLEQMKEMNAGCVRLYPCPGPDEEYGDEHFGIVPRGARYRISTQAALWDPSYLRQIASQCDSPWDFEIKGSVLSNDLEQPVLSFKRELQPWPVSYYGAVRHGQWAPAVKPFMEEMGIPVDWSRRPFQAA